MIVFLNFAPFRFMGGAEKWAYEIAKELSKKEKINLVSVDPKISNLYAKLVLSREFDIRQVSLNTNNIKDNVLSNSSFIPFSTEWYAIKSILKNAKTIYLKYELLEILICIYFAGFSVFSKSIAGLHSPFIYSKPLTFFEHLHNFIYKSSLSLNLLRRMKKVHVITQRDLNFLKVESRLNNVLLFSNAIELDIKKSKEELNKSNNLSLIFVGELILRKGVDILIETIKESETSIQFHVVGNGPFENEIKKLSKEYSNCIYHGYLNKDELYKLYLKSDILFSPARAEGFPLVFHEALAHGLKILDSTDIKVGLPDDIEITISQNNSKNYIDQIHVLQKSRLSLLKNRNEVINYYNQNLAFKSIEKKVSKELFA